MLLFGFAVLGVLGAFLFGYREGRFSLYRKHIGEALVIREIHRVGGHGGHLVNNVTIKVGATDRTTQIDHILVAPTGIYVIETKHYDGWIYGDPRRREWRQVFYRKKIPMNNPVFQNHGHVAELQRALGLPATHFKNLVVFSGRAEFKTDLGPDVIHIYDLADYFARAARVRPVVLDEQRMAWAIGRIEQIRRPRSQETDEYHVRALLRGLA